MPSTINWEIRKYLKEFREDGRLAVLMAIILHSNLRGRCWISTEMLVEETGWSRPAVINAKAWLIDRGALVLVPYVKRVGKEVDLPIRQHIYQITGRVTMPGDEVVKYLFMTPEAEQDIITEAENLRDSKVAEISVALPKGSTDLKGDKIIEEPKAVPRTGYGYLLNTTKIERDGKDADLTDRISTTDTGFPETGRQVLRLVERFSGKTKGELTKNQLEQLTSQVANTDGVFPSPEDECGNFPKEWAEFISHIEDMAVWRKRVNEQRSKVTPSLIIDMLRGYKWVGGWHSWKKSEQPVEPPKASSFSAVDIYEDT